jgi:hypothetical protein
MAAPSIGRSDTASSAHVAITRAIADLTVFTPLDREEFIDHLTSAQALRLPPDAVLFGRIVDRFGGKDSPWARAMQRAQKHAEDPLRRDHDVFCTQRQARYDAVKADIQAHYQARLQTATTGGEKRAARAERDHSLRTAAEDFGPLTFVEWGAANRAKVERHETVREKVADLGRYRQGMSQERSPTQTRERTYTLSPEAAAAIEQHRKHRAVAQEQEQKKERSRGPGHGM